MSWSEWCSLGREMLEEITKNLETRTDILRLRAVCKGWRSSISFPPIINPQNALPFNFPFLPPNTNLGGKAHLLLKETTFCSLKPLSISAHRRWFLKIEQTESGTVLLKNPFPIENFRETENGQPQVISLLDYQVRELGKEYSLDVVQDKSRPPREEEEEEEEEEANKFTKVIVGHNLLEGQFVQFVVMAIHVTGIVQVWKMGEDRWVVIDNGHPYGDIVYHRGRFYAVTYDFSIIAVDSFSLEITHNFQSSFPRHPNPASTPANFLLVKSGYDLYLIFQSYGSILRLDEELGRWVNGWVNGRRLRIFSWRKWWMQIRRLLMF